MNIKLDEGFFFGLGAFETIAVQGSPIFLDRHLDRMNRTLEWLEISERVTREEVYRCLEHISMTRGALKIVISKENRLFLPRENPYTEEVYERGFLIDAVRTRRSGHSPFVFHKTLNYGECILEHRRVKAAGLDEGVFLNGREEICEGTISNIFFVRDGQICTPALSCGLLPGILRGWLLERWDIEERVISAKEVEDFEECFLTNSLMGILPVRRFGRHKFRKRETVDRLREDYKKYTASC